MKIRNEDELRKLREQILAKKEERVISVCCGPGCEAKGAKKLISVFREELKKNNINIEVIPTGCHGFCEQEIMVVIRPENIFYRDVKIEDVKKIVNETIINKKILEEKIYANPKTGEKIVYEQNIPFYKSQYRILSGYNENINPENIDDYIAIGGYSALCKALKMKPEDIISEVKKSGLRGRGGAGFPTAIKWETTKNAHGDSKYIICNADEGDPGAYANRALLAGNPHCVIEGIIIGAFAIGCQEGYIYVRYEYPPAVKMPEIAIDKCREYGFLGKDILSSGFDFDISINRGGGSYVCGESTALMSSLEGKIGEARPKYIHTSEKGLWDKPSCLNNVETFANIPLIINNGSEWFAKIGTEKSKGTKIFSLVGKINNTGLVEVPLGTTLREIIYEIGGGIRNGKKFKAVQTGGPAGGCIPESLIDLPVDYEKLTEYGSSMGSGGMIIIDEDNCMVDITKYFLDFLREESCGKCVPCREGIKQMYRILEDITEGKGTMEELELLEELAGVVQLASLCQLGGSSPNTVLCGLRYFRDEYEQHIKEKKCPANVCKFKAVVKK